MMKLRRSRESYRGHRRNEAKRRRLLWRELPRSFQTHDRSRKRARSTQVWVFLSE